MRVTTRIDRVDLDRKGGALRIVDYKRSDASIKSADKDERKGVVLFQIPVYALSAEDYLRGKGIEIRSKSGEYLVWRSPYKAVHVGLDDKTLERTRANARKMFAAAEAGDYAVEPYSEDKCKLCDYRFICRYPFGEALKEEKPDD